MRNIDDPSKALIKPIAECYETDGKFHALTEISLEFCQIGEAMIKNKRLSLGVRTK